MKDKNRLEKIEVLPNGKKALNKDVINVELLGQKTSIKAYVFDVLWIVGIFAFAYFFNPICFLFLIVYLFKIFKKIRKDIKIKKLKFYIIERPCLNKEFEESDEGSDVWRIWFKNLRGDCRLGLTVEKKYHDDTEIGEEFFLVFIGKETYPSLWYRKSEWELATETFDSAELFLENHYTVF